MIRLADIRAEISGRLWSVNRGMRSDTYNALLDDMALLQLSGEERVARFHGEMESRVCPSDAVRPAGLSINAKGAIPTGLRAPRGKVDLA